MLVVYGSEKKETSEFIRYNDLFKFPPNPKESRYEFKGENALLNALTYLSADRSRATVYFTQGVGELGFKDSRGDAGMGRLIEELGRINYDTHELPVDVDTKTIPDDAEIVVIARPARPFPAKFLSALRDYLQGKDRKEGKKGKLIVLFDVVVESGKGTLVRTGLENLVGGYGIRLKDNQLVNLTGAIISASASCPTRTAATPSPRPFTMSAKARYRPSTSTRPARWNRRGPILRALLQAASRKKSFSRCRNS